jgi:hypothetical protein
MRTQCLDIMPLRIRAWVVVILGLFVIGLVTAAGAEVPPAPGSVDSAPRQPLPSEPPEATFSLARIATLASSTVVVGAVLALVLLVKRREGRRPPRRSRAVGRSHARAALVRAGTGPPSLASER